jgi:hypothetical protein
MEKIRIWDPGSRMEKIRIWGKHPGSATLVKRRANSHLYIHTFIPMSKENIKFEIYVLSAVLKIWLKLCLNLVMQLTFSPSPL